MCNQVHNFGKQPTGILQRTSCYSDLLDALVSSSNRKMRVPLRVVWSFVYISDIVNFLLTCCELWHIQSQFHCIVVRTTVSTTAPAQNKRSALNGK